jgi:hypothetical protein
MKIYRGVDVYNHVFLTLALIGGEWSASRSNRYNPRERALSTHWIGDWVDPGASLDDKEKGILFTLLGLLWGHIVA